MGKEEGTDRENKGSVETDRGRSYRMRVSFEGFEYLTPRVKESDIGSYYPVELRPETICKTRL